MWILALNVAGLAHVAAQTQTASTPIPASNVPRLVSFSGVVKDGAGKPVSGAVSITFLLFAEQEGGNPLWSETQVVNVDSEGKYTVFLGATNPNGLPLDLFTTGAARWLAVQPGVPGLGDQSRILLVGVPYALKAADADTLGGKPASAYLTTDSQSVRTTGTPAATVAPVSAPAVTPATSPTGGGTTDYVPLWTSSTNLGNSILFQSGSVMEVNGALELPSLGTATTSTAYDSQPLDLFASAYNSSVNEAVTQHFRWEAEPVSNDTSSASGKLDLLFGSGTATPAETGLSINSKGVLSFASGQTFPGTGAGTITGVTAGTDLAGGGTSGKVTLNLDTTKVPQLNAANSFTGNQRVTGNITASGYVKGTTGNFENVDTSGGILAEQWGTSSGASAIYAFAAGSTQENFGVEAITTSPAGIGVYGQMVAASAEGAGRNGALWGDTNQTDHFAVIGTADDGTSGAFFNASKNNSPLWAENDLYSGWPASFLFVATDVTRDFNCYIDGQGDLGCTGSKSAVVPVDNGSRKVALYAVEAPENWFEDFGSGQLAGGVATVALESTFVQTVNTGVEYNVFITPYGECEGLYVTNRSAQGFEIHELHGGHSNVAFGYRIVARRKGYETIRLADKTAQLEQIKLRARKTGSGGRPDLSRH